MVETIGSAVGGGISATGGGVGFGAAKPGAQEAMDFSAMLNQGGPVNQSLVSFVENAQQKLNTSEQVMSSKLKDFNTKDQVIHLIEAMHESSMRSVSVQLTGKIGSKVSESFEQLIKQQ